MRKLLDLAIVCFGLALLAGCQGKEAKTRAYYAQLDKMYKGYLSSDPKLAERALLDHETIIREWEKQGVGVVNYQESYKMTEARLLAVYVHMGEEQKARQEYQSLTNILALHASRLNRAPKVGSPQEIVADLERMETNLPVLWRMK